MGWAFIGGALIGWGVGGVFFVVCFLDARERDRERERWERFDVVRDRDCGGSCGIWGLGLLCDVFLDELLAGGLECFDGGA